MDKTFLLRQLGERLRAALQATHTASREASEDARSGAARAVNLARGQQQRSEAVRAQLDALDAFHPRPHVKGQPIGLGALVEVEDGETGKTLFLAPVCGGEELTGPDGDGIIQVVTPVSPFGRALMGRKVGATVEVPLGGDTTEWTITWAG
jgi:transcription elongation GreA/GreB family factor